MDVKAIRERRQWTQEQMAEYLGLDRSTVSRLERGQAPTGSTRILLGRLLEDDLPSGCERTGAAPAK
jgi:transcriptional regulator with XRE-family HTH domain